MTGKELTIAVEWYVFHHGKQPTDLSVFETWIGGYFHAAPRRVRELRNEMRDLELISIEGRKVIIL